MKKTLNEAMPGNKVEEKVVLPIPDKTENSFIFPKSILNYLEDQKKEFLIL